MQISNIFIASFLSFSAAHGGVDNDHSTTSTSVAANPTGSKVPAAVAPTNARKFETGSDAANDKAKTKNTKRREYRS